MDVDTEACDYCTMYYDVEYNSDQAVDTYLYDVWGYDANGLVACNDSHSDDEEIRVDQKSLCHECLVCEVGHILGHQMFDH